MNRILSASQDLAARLEPLPDMMVEPIVASAGNARDGFFIATRHVLLTGTPADGPRSAWLDRKPALQDFQLPLRCRELRQSPLGIERTLELEDTIVAEHIVAAPETPALLIEWIAKHDVEFDIAWTSLDETGAVFVFSAAVDANSRQVGTCTEFQAHVQLEANTPLHMLIAGSPAIIKEADPARWVRAHAGAAQRRHSELLRVEAAGLDRAWQWAMHQVAMDALRAQPDAPTVRALIVLGDFKNAQRLVGSELFPYYHAAAGDDATALPPAPPDPAEADWQPDAEPAALITSFARNVLGYAPDAARGRLQLRPRIPAAWEGAAVHNIPLGDARVRLGFEQTERGCSFRIAQTGGAYPIRLILEPLLLREPSQTLVDGVSAQLNLRPVGDRVLAPVQIMLDDERTIEFIQP